MPSNTQWVAENEFNLIQSGQSDFTTLKGKYHEWLPAVDFDVEPIRNVKLRASYSHTITRPDYASMQGGLTLDELFRVGGGTGSQGNPGAAAVQVEEHRSVGGMVLRPGELFVGRLFPQGRVELHFDHSRRPERVRPADAVRWAALSGGACGAWVERQRQARSATIS